MSDLLANPMTSPKWVPRIGQVGIVIDHGEPSDEDEDYSKRKHNPRMPWIIPTENPYHDRREDPLIGNVGRPLTNGWIVPTTNSGGNGPPRGEPLGGGGSGLTKGGHNDHLGGGSSEHPMDQNPRSYDVGPTRS
jgi:hypothetical protein